MSDANGFPTSGPGQRSDGASRRKTSLLFLASFVALYFELVLIRYLSTEIRVFAYVQNLPLVASFLGLGVGMVLTKPIPRLKRLFPWLTAAIFLLIAHSRLLGIAHLPFAGNDFLVWGQNASRLPVSIAAVKYVGITLGITAMVVAFFVVLGKTVGDYLATEGSLRGYGVNLAGSLAGC